MSILWVKWWLNWAVVSVFILGCQWWSLQQSSNGCANFFYPESTLSLAYLTATGSKTTIKTIYILLCINCRSLKNDADSFVASFFDARKLNRDITDLPPVAPAKSKPVQHFNGRHALLVTSFLAACICCFFHCSSVVNRYHQFSVYTVETNR